VRGDPYESAWERPPAKWRREWRRTVVISVMLVVIVAGFIFALLRP
jgi:hypothetical protein